MEKHLKSDAAKEVFKRLSKEASKQQDELIRLATEDFAKHSKFDTFFGARVAAFKQYSETIALVSTTAMEIETKALCLHAGLAVTFSGDSDV